MKRVVVLLVVVLSALAYSNAFAQSGNGVENGGFENGLTGWASTSGGWSYTTSSHSGSYAVRAPAWMNYSNRAWLISSPVLVGSGAFLDYFVYTSESNANAGVLVLDYTTSGGGSFYPCLGGAYLTRNVWVECSADFSIFNGHVVSLVLNENGVAGSGVLWDDISVSNSVRAGVWDWHYFNGKFLTSSGQWSGAFGDRWIYSGDSSPYDVGYIYSVSAGSNWWQQDIISRPVVFPNENLTAYRNGNACFTIYTLDYDTGVAVDVPMPGMVTASGGNCGFGGGWGQFTIGSGGVPWGGRRLSMLVRVGGDGLALDDICSSLGCDVWYQTPTPVPTSVPTLTPTVVFSPTSGVVYPTIDWSLFPTPPPNATPIYGFGTPVPISGTIKIDDATPVRVQVINNGTPIVVAIATRDLASVLPTKISASYASQYASVGASSSVLVVDVNNPAPFDITRATDHSSPLIFSYFTSSIHACLPDQIGQIVDFGSIPQCVDIPTIAMSSFVLGGVDIVPYFAALTLVIFFVFIIRQIQEH